jgi:hypothetical protein
MGSEKEIDKSIEIVVERYKKYRKEGIYSVCVEQIKMFKR